MCCLVRGIISSPTDNDWGKYYKKRSLGKVFSDENRETVYVKQFHVNKGFCHIGLYSWPDVVNKFKQFFQP